MPIRIMVINDDQDILDLYEALLNEEGYDIITSKLAFEHPAAVEIRSPDLVVLDLKFGTQLEGWKMMQKLRLYRPTASVPIIICTAAVREAREQEDHLRSEGIGIVYKPFAIDHFLSAIHQLLAVSTTGQDTILGQNGTSPTVEHRMSDAVTTSRQRRNG